METTRPLPTGTFIPRASVRTRFARYDVASLLFDGDTAEISYVKIGKDGPEKMRDVVQRNHIESIIPLSC